MKTIKTKKEKIRDILCDLVYLAEVRYLSRPDIKKDIITEATSKITRIANK